MPDSVYISPDLGWANRTNMLDPTCNPGASVVLYADLVATQLTDIGYISLSYRVVTIGGSRFLLPLSFVRELHGDSVKYYYKQGSNSIRSFIFKTDPGEVLCPTP